VRFYFTRTEFLYDYNANFSKAVAAKRLPLTILCIVAKNSKEFLLYDVVGEEGEKLHFARLAVSVQYIRPITLQCYVSYFND